MSTLVLIRHGETDWNVEGRYQGQADPPLNPRGIEQANALARSLRGADLDILYSSPLLRSWQTAQIISDVLEVQLYPEPRLKEIHQGDWQTRLRGEIASLYPDLFARWESEPWEVTPPGGESLAQVHNRVRAAVADLLTRHPGSRLGVVTHRIPIALIKVTYQGLDPNIVRTLKLPNTYCEEIEIEKPARRPDAS